MSLPTMATTTNPRIKDNDSSQDGDADTESICDVEDDEEKCVNITNTTSICTIRYLECIAR